VASAFYRLLMASVLLPVVVAWGLQKRRDIYSYIVINVWRRKDKLTANSCEQIRTHATGVSFEFVVIVFTFITCVGLCSVSCMGFYEAPPLYKYDINVIKSVFICVNLRLNIFKVPVVAPVSYRAPGLSN